MGHRELEKMRIPDERFGNDKEIWIWGTGNTAEMFEEGFHRWERKDQIQGYVDNNPEKWGKLFYGKPIISPDELRKRQNVFTLLCSNQLDIMQSVGRQLDEMCVHWSLLERLVLEDMKEEVLAVYDLFEEERSKKLYEYLVKCKQNGLYPEEDSGLLDSSNGYFSLPEFGHPDPEEIFVDVGCFIGDTIEEYLSTKGNEFKQIYSFEPDEVSFCKAESNIDVL